MTRSAPQVGIQPLPLLTTKLYIPPPRPQLVPRPKLLAHLEAGLAGRLTLLSAPAGFGKTTLLSAWRATAAGSAVPFAWVSLEASDSDPVRFWSYVITALDALHPHSGTTSLALLRSPQPPPIEAVLTPLLNALSALPADAVLVLDDYHLIDAPVIHHALAFLLDHLPPRLHLVLATRTDPPLPLVRLRARHQLTELRAADLRFTQEESAIFLTELMGLTLSVEHVAALEARTEGWIAGLHLAALAIQNRAEQGSFVATFTGSSRYVVDYLVEEVFDRLPAHLQTFLLRTSILDRLCGKLCDAVLGLTTTDDRPETIDDRHSVSRGNRVGEASASIVHRPSSASYSQLVLEEIERANLFLIPLDDERRWYRYHHLFADVLHARLHNGATADEVARLHRRASRWYEGAGLIEEAVRFAILGRDSTRIAELIERHARTLMLTGGNVLLVQSWLAHVPQALVLARPHLALVVGLVLTLTAQFAAAELLLVDAAAALNAPDVSADVSGQLAQLRATIARFKGDGAGSLAYAQQALAQLAPDDSASRAGALLTVGVASMEQNDGAMAQAALTEAAALGERAGIQWIALAALEELMSLQGRQGKLRQVLQTATQAAQLSDRLDGQTVPPAGMCLVGRAEVLYEWNDLAGAAQAGAAATDLLRASVERLLVVRGYVALAHVCQAQGDHDGAVANIQQCAAWFAQAAIVESATAQNWLKAHQARLWVCQGDLAAAAQWAQECDFSANGELGYVQLLTLVRLQLAQHRSAADGLLLDEAMTTLAQLLPTIETRGWTRYLIETLMLQALVYQAQGDGTNALHPLQRALAVAEPEGYIRLFVDEGEPMAALLREAAQRSIAPVYLPRLLAACSQADEIGQALAAPVPPSAPLPVSVSLVEPLSAREIEVLRLIAQGHSNQAIADTLVLAVSTVKRHINNIYGKLDVQSRTQALMRARELHLL